ncbi:MAG: hypothetical protein A2270_00130 [Elusimicrobia bacterium RIFOXYA12_FULL_51_18]|nr:MAG: hypothetical protein A2270_00130 [Elusimicrobia bacterium RIFOXYA12_FULL_51_18]OGS32332.1 MAG: hypothetical protein A2218_02970 [Elusimicrobia bacterium RIFOXYA2_FULL_53_38]
MKILIVEDDQSIRTLMEQLLEKRGYLVESSGNGRDALEKARISPPDLIVSDIMMPEMDGFIFCRKIKADERLKKIPVILYTGTKSEKDEEELALGMGAVRFLAKPADINVLLAAIKEELVKADKAKSALPAQAPAAGAEVDHDYLRVLSRKLLVKEQELADTVKRLAESEGMYRRLVENIPDIIYSYSTKRGRVYYSSSVEAVLGYSCDFLLKNPFLWDSSVHPEDKSRVAQAISGFSKDRGFDLEYRIKSRTGDWQWFRDRSVGMHLLGNEVIIDGIATDISGVKRSEQALRQSEFKYKRIFENLQDVFYQTDMNGRIIEISPSIQKQSGYTREELIGRLVAEMYVDREDSAKLMCVFQKAGEIIDYELRLKVKGGRPVYVSVNARVFFDQKGSPAGIEGSLRDISARIRAEEALRGSEECLRQTQKLESIRQLSGGVAHDLNNLLGPVIGYAGLLQKSFTPGDSRREDVGEIIKAAERAASLVRQLLAFSRKQVMAPRIINLNDRVNNIGAMLRRVIGERVRLVFALAPDIGPVKVDPGQMDQVILNLVLNARDAMPQGGDIVIETSGLELSAPAECDGGEIPTGSYVVLGVKDTGCGMDKAVKARIFEPFFTTKKFGAENGLGLGLSTSYGIVKQSGGEIQVESEPGTGSVFKIYLPLIKGGVVEAEEKAGPAAVLAAGKGRILVVEDDESMRRITKRVLAASGYAVTEAADARQALAFLSESLELPALMITDLAMPEMDGLKLSGEVSAKYPDMKILCMSGYMDKEDELEKLLGSKAAYLQKPFSPDALLRKVDKLLRPA